MKLEELIRAALEEDIGAGDWTTRFLVSPQLQGKAQVISREAGILSGLEAFAEVFRQLDEKIGMEPNYRDGDAISAGDFVIGLEGSVAPILTGERTALNFLQRLSGMATLTRKYVDAVQGTKAVILDTRKTTPLLRALEKAAVRHGGGSNHRFGLHDMILIKENHQYVAGGIAAAIWQAKTSMQKSGVSQPLQIEVEIQNLDQLDEALKLDVDRIMLDNFSLRDIRQAVRRVDRRVPLEVSGGVNLENVRQIALTGVDYISVGALTHSAKALDFSLLLSK